MQLSSEKISQFQLLYKKHFGEEISRQDAIEEGMKLVSLMKLIYKPISQDELQQFQKSRQSN